MKSMIIRKHLIIPITLLAFYTNGLAVSTNLVNQSSAAAPQAVGSPKKANPPVSAAAAAKPSPAPSPASLARPVTRVGSPPPAGSPDNRPHHIPPSVLKKYDADTNGVLDSAEWNHYRQDLEKQRAEWLQSRAATNAPPSVTNSSKPKKKKH